MRKANSSTSRRGDRPHGAGGGGGATVADCPAGQARATAADLDALCQLESESFNAADAFSRQQYRQLLRNEHASVHVIRVDGRLAGSAILLRRRCRWGSVTGRLYSLAVSPAYRGRGYGQVLLDDVLATCRRETMRRLFLEVRADNRPAIGLYQKNGFVIEHELADYYGPGQPGLKMVRRLEQGQF